MSDPLIDSLRYRPVATTAAQMRDARNGRIIGASTEGYVRQSACLKNLERVIGLRVGQTQGDVQRVVGLSSRMFTSWELKQP